MSSEHPPICACAVLLQQKNPTAQCSTLSINADFFFVSFVFFVVNHLNLRQGEFLAFAGKDFRQRRGGAGKNIEQGARLTIEPIAPGHRAD